VRPVNGPLAASKSLAQSGNVLPLTARNNDVQATEGVAHGKAPSEVHLITGYSDRSATQSPPRTGRLDTESRSSRARRRELDAGRGRLRGDAAALSSNLCSLKTTTEHAGDRD
jgi:hypothetical protein